MPRAELSGRSVGMYWAARRARSALMAARSMSVTGPPWGTTHPFGMTSLVLQDPQFDGDVAPGRTRVRADLVRRLGELARLVLLHPGDVDDQRHDQAE